MNIDICEVMKSIYNSIDEKNMTIAELYGGTAYYSKCIEKIKQYESVVVVGAGNHGKKLLNMFDLEKISSNVNVCDNNPKLQGNIIGGHTIVSIKDAVSNYKDSLFVITPAGYENELLQQICNLGVSYKDILIFIMMYSGLRME